MKITNSSRLSHTATVIIVSSVLAACGGGGGGGAKASTDSRAINSQNQTQIVAAVMGQSGPLHQASASNEAPAALMTRARVAVSKARAARAAVEVPGYCSSGRMLFDDETGVRTYEACELRSLEGASLRLDGTFSEQDFSDDPDAEFDFVIGYDLRVDNQFANGDLITFSLDGRVVGNLTGAGDEHAETTMQFATDYDCGQGAGSFTGDYDIVSDVTVSGDESAYVENGQMRFLGGTWIFRGTLDIETTEPLRYRDGYNDDHPYDGAYRISATDGSSVTLTFALGGIYVDDRFYTWAQFEEEVVIDEIYASCGEA